MQIASIIIINYLYTTGTLSLQFLPHHPCAEPARTFGAAPCQSSVTFLEKLQMLRALPSRRESRLRHVTSGTGEARPWSAGPLTVACHLLADALALLDPGARGQVAAAESAAGGRNDSRETCAVVQARTVRLKGCHASACPACTRAAASMCRSADRKRGTSGTFATDAGLASGQGLPTHAQVGTSPGRSNSSISVHPRMTPPVPPHSP